MRILMVGLGSAGQRHLRNLQALLGREAQFLAYRVQRRRFTIGDDVTANFDEDVETKHDVRVFSSLEAALGERPTVAVIANPNALHVPIAMQAARAGCHLFIEKPLSHTEEGVEELIELVEHHRLVAMVGYQLRFHPGVQLVRSLLREERVGRLISAEIEIGEYLPGMHAYEDYREAYTAKRCLGGGVILSHSHEIDYACWLFGVPRRVIAVGGQLSDLEVDVEDTADITMECASNGHRVMVHIHQDFIQQPPVRVCRIVGENGQIVWDYYAGVTSVFDAGMRETEVHDLSHFQRNTMFMDEMRHFLACLRGEAQPLISLREGLVALRVALAAKASIEQGRVIEWISSP